MLVAQPFLSGSCSERLRAYSFSLPARVRVHVLREAPIMSLHVWKSIMEVCRSNLIISYKKKKKKKRNHKCDISEDKEAWKLAGTLQQFCYFNATRALWIKMPVKSLK